MIKRIWNFEHTPHILAVIFLLALYWVLVDTVIPYLVVGGLK